MAVTGKITVDTEVRTAGWSKGLADGGKDLQAFASKAQSQFRALTLDKGFNAKGITSFGGALAKTAKQAEEVATQLRTGAGYGEVFGSAVKSIPIVGTFVKAGEAIRELVKGSKAAVIEAEKWSESARKVAEGYRSIAAAAALRGKYGDERASQQIENDTNKQISALHGQREQLTAELGKVESKDANIGWYSKAQMAEMSRIRQQQKLIDQQILSARADGSQALLDQKREIAERDRQFERGEEEQRLGFAAAAEMRSLRAQHKRLESAQVAIRADADARIRAEMDKVTPYALAGLDDAQKTDRLRQVSRTIAQIEKDRDATLAEQQEQQALKAAEIERDNAETILKIRAEGNIARLAQIDEQANAEAERRGIATRSHLADAAKIQEEYRQTVAQAEEKYRKDNQTQDVDASDPELAGAIAAAKERQSQQLGLLANKGQKRREPTPASSPRKSAVGGSRPGRRWISTGRSLTRSTSSTSGYTMRRYGISRSSDWTRRR